MLLILSYSQSSATTSLHNLKLQQLSVEQGLTQGTIKLMLQDQSGLIWIATENGINVYDGYHFKQLQDPDGGYKSIKINVLKEDSRGLIWINFAHKGLYTFNPKNNKYELIFKSKTDDNASFVTSLVEGSNGDVWITTAKKVIKYNFYTKHISQKVDLTKKLPSLSKIYSVTINNTILYIGTELGIYAFDIESDIYRKIPDFITNSDDDLAFNSIEAKKIYAQYVYDDRFLYIASNDGVFSLNIQNISEFIKSGQKLPSPKLIEKHISTWSIFPQDQDLYFATETGLWHLNMQTTHMSHMFGFSDAVEYLSSDHMLSVMIDRQGSFWLGSSSTGVYKWNPKRELITNFQHMKNNDKSLSHSEVWSILQHNSNEHLAWVGTANGLNLIDRQNNSVERFFNGKRIEMSYSENHISNIIQFNDTTLLLNTSRGIRFFDTINKQFITINTSQEILSLFEEASGYISKSGEFWLHNLQGIFQISLETNTVKQFKSNDPNLHLDNIYTILGYLPNSNLLLLSFWDALWSLDVNTGIYKMVYRHANSLKSEYPYILNWLIDNNTLWLVIYNKGLVGLSLDDLSITHQFNNENSIIDNVIYGINKDKDGDLWFSSHTGVYLLDHKTHHIRHFGTSNGFSAREFNGNATTQLVDGHFAFGSTAGVSIFDPMLLKQTISNEQSTAKITGVEVLSRAINSPLLFNDNQIINLKHDDIGIKINFSNLNYQNNDHVKYKYKLTGNNTITYPASFENQVTFPNLSSGKHVFEVQAQQPLTGTYSEPNTITFVVDYAPWLSPFAYTIYAVILGLSGAKWFIYRQRQRIALLNAHEEVKQRENRLQLALKGSNSEVWEWQLKKNHQFSERISRDLGYNNKTSSLAMPQYFNLIHPDDVEQYLDAWLNFINKQYDLKSEQDNFSFTYRLRSAEGHWLWYRDLGKVVSINKEGKATKITGAYSNITQTKADEERSQYYGEAFQNTQDWVMIISEDRNKMIANQTFCHAFNLPHSEISFDPKYLGFEPKRTIQYNQLIDSLNENENSRTEEVIQMPNGTHRNVIINISMCKTVGQKGYHYLCVMTDISALKKAEQELRHLASYDHLTNLPNRTLLLSRVEQTISSAQRNNTSFALLFIDLDRFKQVNDSLGHDIGDILLKNIASRLTTSLRSNDTVARLGGDEFVVLLDIGVEEKSASCIAEKILKEIQEPITLNGTVVSVGASIGISMYPNNGDSSDKLLKSADLAMYSAKNEGRDNYKFYTPQMNIEAAARLEKESNIKLAHINNEFINHYQPIVDGRNNNAVGVELLMRWDSPHGLISPFQFIPIAEEIGLIIQMTEAALVRGLNDLKHWQETKPDFYLSINLSPKHFMQENLVEFIQEQLKVFNISTHTLRVEVTESMLISDPQKAIDVMKKLSKTGVKIALDDFGTGFSSLSYLKQLPLDIIKIDRSFVSGIGENPADEAIIEATLVLAKNLNMACIAEGIETASQRDYLIKRNCNLIQGYYYSKPMSAEFILNNESENVA